MRFLREPDVVGRGIIENLFSTRPSEEYLDRLAEASKTMPVSSAVTLLLDYIVVGGDWSSVLQTLERPLLYAVAPNWADDAQELRELVPGATIEVFEGARHGLFVEQHEKFNRVLADFLKGIE